MTDDRKTSLRAWDFWAAIVLLFASLFFLLQTSAIPFFKADAAGVDSGKWYNSAALVPYVIFIALLFLSLGLLVIAIRDGGAARALKSCGLSLDREEVTRVGCIVIILTAYIGGLVPRVDFILSSALLIMALTFGFIDRRNDTRVVVGVFVVVPALYATLAHFDRAEWSKPHDDDWVALAAFLIMVIVMVGRALKLGQFNRIVWTTPIVAFLIPTILVTAMAFGFRQNVPNRGGLLFSQIEYHYYVDIRPWLQGQ
ncbi:MAG: hypothetical protein AAF530_10400 [Pseudomonadota bacterium]